MIEAAARAGWIDRERIILETTTAIKRAGADILITYYALELAKICSLSLESVCPNPNNSSIAPSRSFPAA